MTRECGQCTECCIGALSVTIEGIPVTKDNPCKYCDNGCTVHDAQPEKVCSEFHCGWIMDEQLPDDMRPDLSGAIMLQAKYFWMSRPVDMAVPTGIEIPSRTLRFIQHYSKNENRPLIYCKRDGEGRLIYPYGPSEFQDDIEVMVNKGHQFI